MTKESSFLTKEEKSLCDEIIRVSEVLKKGSLALTGHQYGLLKKIKKKEEYRGQYEKRLANIELFYTEERRRRKKRDTADMFS